MTSLKLPLQITVDKHESRSGARQAGLLVGRRRGLCMVPTTCNDFSALSSLKLKEKTATFLSRPAPIVAKVGRQKRMDRIAFELPQSNDPRLNFVSEECALYGAG